MRKRFLLVVFILGYLSVLSSCKHNEEKCTIIGNTIGISDTTLVLFKINEDPDYYGITIPVKNGSFNFEKTFIHPEAYYLMFKEGGLRHTFFIEPGKVKMTIYPESEFYKSFNKGSSLNNEYNAYKSREDNIYLPLLNPIQDSINSFWISGKYLYDTIRWNNLERRFNEISSQRASQRIEYINNHQSLVSYFFLYDILARYKDTIDINLITNSYHRLANQYKDHPYTISIGNTIESIKNIHIGGRYIDFSAQTQIGELAKLSNLITGKVALLSLWSPWCGSCIKNNRALVPIYNEFQKKGFVIVGVASDIEQKRIDERIRLENHPWVTLVEIDKQYQIWEKYGINNWGGRSFLIGKNGNIIAIDPSADEIRNKLQELLK